MRGRVVGRLMGKVGPGRFFLNGTGGGFEGVLGDHHMMIEHVNDNDAHAAVPW